MKICIRFMLMIYLTEEERKSYKALHKSTRRKQDADRIKTILLLDQGYSPQEIAEILLIDEGTVRRWLARFEVSGIKALLEDKYKGKTSKLTQEEQKALSTHLEEHLYLTAKQIATYINHSYGVVYTIKGVTKLLHRLGFCYKKPCHIPGKADAESQEAFVRKYQQLKAEKAREDSIYFMDGVHPLHNSQPAYGWIRKGEKKMLKSNTGRQRLNINGAYNIETHKVVVRTDKSINAQSTVALLKQLLKEQPLGMLYIILDNARYYRSQLVKDFVGTNERIELVFLPAYSPNLNIIERLWRFFKKNITYNRYYEKFSVFEKNCLDFFENIDRYKNELKNLMADNFYILQT